MNPGRPHPLRRFGRLLLAAYAAAALAQAAETKPLKDACKNAFQIGVAINRSVATGTAFRRRQDQVDSDIALVKHQFNQVSPENDLKWALIHPREGTNGYEFGPADAFVKFGLENNMSVVGHTLVWHAQTPFWVFRGTNPPPGFTNTVQASASSGAANAPQSLEPGAEGPARRPGMGFGRGPYTGPRASRDELLERMREHIHTVVGRYKGKIQAWDVVNEAIADGGTNLLRKSLWLEIIGPDYIAKAFEYAHEADPNAILRYNDYGLEDPTKRRKLLTLIQSLQAQKVPVMAIGTQTHISVAGPDFDALDRAFTEMKSLGLPIHVTELDVNSAQGGQRMTGAEISDNAAATQGGLVADSNRQLADRYADLFKALLKHKDAVKMVTFWGVNDAVSWRSGGKPLLFDGENKPKPAFDAVLRVITGEGLGSN